MIAGLLEKDLKLFFRNPFIAFITVLGLAFYIAAYLLLPTEVNQTLGLALYIEDGAESELSNTLSEAIEATLFDSQEAMITAVEAGDYPVGLALTNEVTTAVKNGEQGVIPVYYAPGTTPNVRDTYNDVMTVVFNDIQFGENPPISIKETTEVLGPQFLDEPISTRDHLLPVLVLIIYLIEMMGLAGLIMEETESGTARGILTTPLSLGQFFSAKAIMGVGLAFIQAVLLLLITGVLFKAPLIVLLILLISGLFISGIAFLIASLARDFMSVMGLSILFIMGLLLPGITVLAPGLASNAVNLIPSYFVVDTLHRAINLQATWGDISGNLLILLVVSVVLLGLGSALLRRRLI